MKPQNSTRIIIARRINSKHDQDINGTKIKNIIEMFDSIKLINAVISVLFLFDDFLGDFAVPSITICSTKTPFSLCIV
jgi:hypothetical protein